MLNARQSTLLGRFLDQRGDTAASGMPQTIGSTIAADVIVRSIPRAGRTSDMMATAIIAAKLAPKEKAPTTGTFPQDNEGN